MKIALSAETTVDFSKELLEKYNIKTVPFTIVMGGMEYLDGEIDNEQMFDFVRENKTLPSTCAVNKYQYEQHFKKLLKDSDAIIHFCMSGELSCAYQNALEAKKEFDNVYVVDTRSLSTGIGLLAMKAHDLIEAGKNIDKILTEINNLVPKLNVSLILDKLNYLHKGGRCSGLTLLGSNLLQIRPQIVLKNGKLGVGKKYIGKIDSVAKKYCNDVLNIPDENIDKEHAFLAYTSATEAMLNTGIEALKAKGFKNIYLAKTGATITTHVGPKAMGLLFFNK